MDYEQITYEVDGHVAVLTYDRPEQRNAVSRRMNAELHDAWRRFRDDDDAFVLVVTGAGDAFCAGWDLQDAADWPRPEWDEFRTHVYDSAGDCGYTRRVDVFKPVIAAVNGWAAGAGLYSLLASTDIRIASAEHARFKFALLTQGWLGHGPGASLLVKQLRYIDAMKILLTDEPFDAQ
jgi:enoyl-CoA hydratase/carnithine racemase